MIFSSNAASEWFRALLGKARLVGLAVLFAGLGGCAISMPIPGLMEKETTGSIAAKPGANSTDKPVTAAATAAEAPVARTALGNPEAVDN
jgi:hypothetical protein